MNQNFNIFNQVDMPSIELCTPNLEKVQAIGSLISNTKVILKYNAISEFSFNFPQSIDGNITILDAYDLIKTKKYLHIENIGYFIIQEVQENDEGTVKIKEVKCESLESELKNKKVTDFSRISVPIIDSLIDVTYQYIPVEDGSGNLLYYELDRYENEYANPIILSSTSGSGIIDTILATYAGNWSIDTTKAIPESLATLGGEFNDLLIATIVRGFDVSDTNVYNFLSEEVEKAFGCAVIFSKEERKLHFEDMNSIEETNIFLSYDNLLKSSKIIEYSDEIATSLSCYGKSDISVNYANPLGTSKLYNFEYFKTTEWMSQTLIDLIDSWNTAINLEISGSTSGSHLGEAWGEGFPSYYSTEDIRFLDVLYNMCTGFDATGYLGYGTYYLYPLKRRRQEIARLKREMGTFVPSSDEIKYYKTNIDFLYIGFQYDPYPTVTSEVYYNAIPELLYSETTLTSGSQIITTGITQPSTPRCINVVSNNTSFSGTVKITGTDETDAGVYEDLVFSSDENVRTTQYFKTITQIDFPGYTILGDTLYVEGDFEYIGSSISIPSLYQLVDSMLYRWSVYGGYYIIIAAASGFWTGTIEYCITQLNKLENGEAYSHFVEYLFDAYELLYNLDIAQTAVENIITEQEILKTTAIELKDENKKEDHATNILFLKQFVISGLGGTDIPSESSGIPYTLNSNDNQLDRQQLIDNYLINGTTTDGETVDYYNGYGGLYPILSRIEGTNYFINSLNTIMSTITSALNPVTYFGGYYTGELAPFIIENTYQNEYAVNYSGEIKDKVATAIDLYNQGLEVLDRVSSPRYEFSIDSINFLNLYEYKDTFTNELELGKKIRLNIKDSIVNTILLEISYSFDNLEQIDMIFGNRLRLDDVRFQFTDFVGQIYKTGSNVSFKRTDWNEFPTDYKDPVDNLIDYPIENVNNTSLSDMESISVGDQTYEVAVTKSGLLIRKRLSEDTYSDKEILLTNGMIAYTTNGWTTSASYINN